MAQATPGEILLGFDARERWFGEEEPWGAEWITGALLRRDIDKPLSIDRLVWPSIFDFHPELEPRYTGLYGQMWESLEQLERHLRQAALTRDHWLVAFAVMPAACDSEQLARSREWGENTSPKQLDSDWQLLGYDVADDSANSSLVTMRAAGDATHPKSLRTRWGPHLNRAHLFADCSQAAEFKRFSDQAIPDHAPFFVYGIWFVRVRGDSFPDAPTAVAGWRAAEPGRGPACRAGRVPG